MSIRYALLGLLAKQPQTGYDLFHTFKTQQIYYWSSTHSQVYKELGKMEEEHLTTHDIVYQEGSPNKKVYTITPDGERHLIEWMIHTKSKPAKIKDEFLIKTSAFHVISKEEAISLLHRMKTHNEMVVTGTGQWKEQTFQGKKPGYEQVGEYLTAEYGIRYAQMYVDWCDWAIKEIQSLPENTES
ncbi:PadR family transcriptional regulator [Rossellomorea marisflavi]|uniref:PadR family transcriptional regulator n=1 Tax=Rossellomorea marisflavi TaxID=189381 RepID=UPI00296F4AA1|nr:PadR family transcriptional regulator [Rossellomorea marisflavi]MDW4526926.1 PadR family transcriptional regulator [Rossellomorea marisflavi]